MNPDDLLFVYARDGQVSVMSREFAHDHHKFLLMDGWKHTATINPRLWLEAVCNSGTHSGPRIDELKHGIEP